MKKILPVILFVLIAQFADGQAYDAYFEKIGIYYEEGEYLSALKQISSLRKKLTKAGATDGPIAAVAQLKDAQCHIALGYLDKGLTMLDKAVEMSVKVNQVNSADHAIMLKDASEVYIQYGHYQKADQYAKQSLAIFDQNGLLTEDMRASFQVSKAAILVGMGYYTSAIRTIDNELPFFKGRTTVGGKKELVRNKRDYASLLVSRANALRKMGDYLKADSSFVANELWMERELSRKDINYGLNKYLNGLLLEENGLALDPLTKFYEKSYGQLRKDYSDAHYITMDVRDKLMRTYYRNDKKSKLTDVQDDMRKTLRKYHDETSVYSLVKQTLKYDYRLSDQALKGLENEISNILHEKGVIPKFHEKRVEMLNLAYRAAILDNKLKNAQGYLEEIINVQKELIGETAPEFHLTKIRLANFYIDNTDYYDRAKVIYDNSWKQVVSPEISGGHPLYIEILNHLASFYMEDDAYTLAANYLDEALYQARKKWDNKDVGYATALERIAGLEIKLGNYLKAGKYLDEALLILEKEKTKDGLMLYTNALVTQIPLLIVYGEYDKAESNLLEIDKIRAKNDIRVVSSANVLDDMAELFLKLGRYAEAKINLDMSLRFKRERFSAESRQLIRPLVLYAKLHLMAGEYAEAENRAREAFNISKKIYGDQSTKLIPGILTLAEVYKTIGDYTRAEQLLRGALAIQTKKLGENHVDVAVTNSELALTRYFISSNRAEVERLFRQSEQIVGSTLGASNPVYADILKNLAIVNISSGDFAEAESYLDNAAAIWDKRIGRRNNINSSMVDVLYGDIRYNQKNYKSAQDYYTRAQKRYAKFFSENHPEYLKTLSKLSKAYYMQGNIKDAQKAMEEVLQKYQAYIKDYFPALGEREKAKFWNTIRTDYEFYNSIIVSNKSISDDMVGALFNNALLTKSLLLSSSIKVRERIMNSGDNALIETYKEWVKSKEQLTVTLAMSPEDIATFGIDVPTLTYNIELLEKQLSLKSEDFGMAFDSRITKWEEVRNAIQPGEVAVEMVRFRFFEHTFSDKIMYAVLYVDGDNKSKAKMVLLENGKELETKYLKIYRNSMKFKVEDTHSYDQFWKPFVGKISYATTIFLSPDGVFNQINLESIPLPGEEGKYVLDAANIVLVSNTKDLFMKKATKQRIQQSKIAAMFGNPTFYVSTKPGRKVQEGGGERATSDVITQLPGTEKEILELNSLLGRNGWRADQFTEYEANEGTIKKIDNPRIFHIATHGFFKTDDGSSAMDDLVANEIVHNPLMRSGLLLTGAGDILNVTDYNFNINDGILTAYEAMNLNLDQTELVVLSACETGLGEIEAGEGVFGLQRAFLVAGAKSVIMSLFKVSDDATQKLMIKFYEKWLATGNIRESFLQAKKDIRAEYVDPIYWGPFVMIGLN